jgi:hypothetical protein
MFDSKTKITTRLTDAADLLIDFATAADLLIDFATLGEYGLEPVGRTRQGCADPAPAAKRTSSTRAIARSGHCNLLEESGLFRDPRQGLARSRGDREASRTFSADGAA